MEVINDVSKITGSLEAALEEREITFTENESFETMTAGGAAASGLDDSSPPLTPTLVAKSHPRQRTPLKLTKRAEAVLQMSNEEFVKDLLGFMERIGQPITKMPSLGYQELDLPLLFRSVIARGGMDEVTRKQEWKLVYQDLGLPTMSTSASYNTRTNYKKYLYLYELEVCDLDEEVPPGMEPKFKVSDYVRIESSTYEGQVFYAQISKYRYRNNTNMYYVHYNGWSTSHDEWMPEVVLDKLTLEEEIDPSELTNPSPTRSSKSNYIIYDPLISERHHPPPQNPQPQGNTMPAVVKMSKGIRRKKSSTTITVSSVEGSSHVGDQFEDAYLHRRTPSDEHDAEEGGNWLFEAALAEQRETLYDGTSSSAFEGSPQLGFGVKMRGGKRRGANINGHGKWTIFREELEHLVEDEHMVDVSGGCPKDHLNLHHGEPVKVYYNGGRWKHSTPRVRKFYLHLKPILDLATHIPFESTLLEGIREMPLLDLESIRPLIPTLSSKSSTKPSTSTVANRARQVLGEVKNFDKRSNEQLEVSIAETKARLRFVHKDLKKKLRLLEKYYSNEINDDKNKSFSPILIKSSKR